jgi:hypothetical protein
MLEPQSALDHRIVVIEVAIAEAAVSDEEVDDEPQKDHVRREDPTAGLPGKAAPEAAAQVQSSDQRLQDHEPGEGGQLLIFEAKIGDRLAVGNRVCFTSLH